MAAPASREFRLTAVQREASALLGGKARHTLLFGGSRSGKTFVIIAKIVARALIEPESRHCCLRKYFSDINRAIICDTFPAVMKMVYPEVRYTLNKSLFFVSLPNGSEIWFGGLDAGDKILGNEYATIYFNEVSQIEYSQIETAYSRNAQKCSAIKNRFYYDENPVGKTHWSYRLFVQGVNPADNTILADPENYCSMRMNPADNRDNLSDAYLGQLRTMSSRNRARFLEGEWQDDSENALWKRSTMIDPFRAIHPPAELERLVIGVDPAVTSADASDLTGIVAAGMARNAAGEPEYYVLEDRSLKASPNDWAGAVIDLYDDLDADRVVAEVNNGGDLVEALLRRTEPSVSFRAVRATRGKLVRAEPIAALYERGIVHHVGSFQELEDQMCNYTGAADEKSPDRMDALVWALTELSSGSGEVSESEAEGLL